MIDWKALARKLSEPWWSPLPPRRYTISLPNYPKAGVGLIVQQDYGAWNLTLLQKGTFTNPTSLIDHQEWVATFVKSKQLAEMPVKGQPLGSYAMLMSPREFANWARGYPKSDFGWLVQGAERLAKLSMKSGG